MRERSGIIRCVGRVSHRISARLAGTRRTQNRRSQRRRPRLGRLRLRRRDIHPRDVVTPTRRPTRTARRAMSTHKSSRMAGAA